MAAKKKTAKAAGDGAQVLVVTAPRMTVMPVTIVGIAPLVLCRFSEKAAREMEEKQKAGGQARSKHKRKPKDFEAAFRDAAYRSDEGWYGFNAAAIRNAMVSACRLVDFKMTIAKLTIFTREQGYATDSRGGIGLPLIRIDGPPPEMYVAPARLPNGVFDLRVRPLWRKWKASFEIEFDEDKFSPTDIINLLLRAGMQVGIGEGRPDSKASCGMGLGRFTVEGHDDDKEKAA